VSNNIATARFRLQSYDFLFDGYLRYDEDFETTVGVSTSKIYLVYILSKNVSNENKMLISKMASPNRLDNYKCYLVILCAYIETQIPDVNMEGEVVAVYYGMSLSVDRSRKLLR